jgi:flagellar biosynthesis chaperone FliJ
MVKRLFRAAGASALAAIGLFIAIGLPPTHAQTAAGSPSDQLVSEVQQLRSEIKQAADSSLRAQLSVARLQLQEQRVNALAQQLSDVQDRLTAVRQQQDGARQRLAATEEGQALLAPADRSDDQSRALRMQIDQLQARIDGLSTQEATLAAQIATGQARWNEFNDRLDTLERSLSGTSR